MKERLSSDYKEKKYPFDDAVLFRKTNPDITKNMMVGFALAAFDRDDFEARVTVLRAADMHNNEDVTKRIRGKIDFLLRSSDEKDHEKAEKIQELLKKLGSN